MAVSVYWLIAAALLLALEAFGLPGIGFLFLGLAAMAVGMFVELGLIGADAVVAQWAIFFLTTSLLALLLWRKLKSWRMNPNQPQYSNIVGTEARVKDAIIAGEHGSVHWSGTTMRARANTDIAAGTLVIVQAVEGNVLTVAPK